MVRVARHPSFVLWVLQQSYFRLFYLVVGDELSVASIGFHQGLVVSSLQDLPILQDQDVIAELQILEDTSKDSHVNKTISACWQKPNSTVSAAVTCTGTDMRKVSIVSSNS